MVTLFNHLSREQADTFSLVLNSAAIGNRVIGSGHGFRIEVPEPYLAAARDAIDRYEAENPAIAADRSDRRSQPLTTTNLSGIGIAFVLLAVHLAVVTSVAPQDYIDTFGANARRILDGELYRCATALVLHADAAHIAGNMAGVALFGSAVGAISGLGVGWLMILASGIFGNLINAMAYETGHLSVGASTAVFGAVGILCAIQAVNAVRTGKGWKRMLLVLGAGVALLGFLGTSARSDMGAHLFGFLIGVVMGSAYGTWIKQPLGGKMQVLCGAIAVSVLPLSWICGVMR